MHCFICNNCHGINYDCNHNKLYDLEERKIEKMTERINEILKENGQILVLRDDGLFEIKDVEKQSDWKTLDVNCLPSDILVGDYEFEVFIDSEWIENFSSIITIIANLTARAFKYRYRPTPTKKSHEELAEEYLSQPYTEQSWHKEVKKAFIAGRKSMEGEG